MPALFRTVNAKAIIDRFRVSRMAFCVFGMKTISR